MKHTSTGSVLRGSIIMSASGQQLHSSAVCLGIVEQVLVLSVEAHS